MLYNKLPMLLIMSFTYKNIIMNGQPNGDVTLCEWFVDNNIHNHKFQSGVNKVI